MNILSVDDSRTARQLFKVKLRQAGFEQHTVHEAGDVDSAYEKVAECNPDFVFCDWVMPNKTGLVLLEMLRADGNQVPFGFVTSMATDQTREAAASAGANFLISKDELTVEKLQELLANQG